jgi:hypothetical protein
MDKLEEFFSNRIPFFIDENARIKIPSRNDQKNSLIQILNQAGYSWIGTPRGYVKDDYAMLYSNDYQIPNCNVILLQAIFAYFPQINWIGLGCIIGESGEFWKPRLKVFKELNTSPIVI